METLLHGRSEPHKGEDTPSEQRVADRAPTVVGDTLSEPRLRGCEQDCLIVDRHMADALPAASLDVSDRLRVIFTAASLHGFETHKEPHATVATLQQWRATGPLPR